MLQDNTSATKEVADASYKELYLKAQVPRMELYKEVYLLFIRNSTCGTAEREAKEAVKAFDKYFFGEDYASEHTNTI